MSDDLAAAARMPSAFGRHRVKLALASLVCGLGLAVSGVTLVRAADDMGLIDFFRSERLSRLVDPIRLRPRHETEPRFVVRPEREMRRREARRRAIRAKREAADRATATKRAFQDIDGRLPRASAEDAPRGPVSRKARIALAAMSTAPGRRTMCVRTCDGYLFPVGTLHSRGDLETHRTACSAACPGAETQLYTLAPGQALDDPSAARSVLDGTVYGRLKTAFLFRKKVVGSCECQPANNIARLPILLDPTLRRGDVVVDARGDAKAFGGRRVAAAFGDYETSGALTRQAKAQVDRLMGTSVRRRIAADYERRRIVAVTSPASLEQPGPTRARLASFGTVREVEPPRGSGAGVRAYTVGQGTATIHASGARIITIE